ncbi:uncharacterized protein LOC118201454 isoform X1 [Stegodyphus dumicola]|uniref:uncharacterized protein LOC118201454 isoform X1 n=1 Tax=Stegodyphus dumicola TaxID=202533 RepID=UPI0015AD6EF4|nr:uncharacterized protein LOC118201454 isoform X1 [Stegodyphus dumicola]XP_035229450.1 uncharacterized protein LOC118201454 isoform X1 [Stegodyphus dumicola]
MFRRFSARRYAQGLCFVILVSTLPIFLLLSKQKTVPYFVQEHPYFHYDLDLEEPRNFDQKCLIPRLHPFDPSIWRYLSSQRSIICKSRTSDLIYIDINGRLKYNDSGVQSNGYKVGKSLFCYWSPVKRGGVNADDDDSVAYGKQVLLEADGIQLRGDTDFIRVQCKNFAKITVYDKIHAYIRNASKPAEEPSRNRINVLIFGIDSLSRLAFIRYLPKTYRYLTESLKMTVFRGINKIGDNTYPNLVALLTGREAYGGNLPDESKGFDEWPLIWKNYSSAGYATMWAEDFASFGLFNYLAKGFRRPPTLHYLRPFWLAVEESSLLKISSHMCYGSTPKHKLQVHNLSLFYPFLLSFEVS